MSLEPAKIKKMYTGMKTRHYDLPISHFFNKYKNLAFKESSLKQGDRVLVFCCGSGLDFPHILEKIGEKGKITGIDFSADMLKIAQKRITKNNWTNIKLVEADVTELSSEIDNNFDVGICTLGISIIPEYFKAYHNLLSRVKQDGEIIIGDAQFASGWQAFFNPIIIFMGKRYGATQEGHKNSLELCKHMKKDLSEVSKRDFFMKTYFYCIGKKK
jgi:ubiquinone/menaquinone biosynthesis C-methylase UbiE